MRREKRSLSQAGEYSKYCKYENFVKFANKLEADANEAEEDKYYSIVNAAIR